MGPTERKDTFYLFIALSIPAVSPSMEPDLMIPVVTNSYRAAAALAAGLHSWLPVTTYWAPSGHHRSRGSKRLILPSQRGKKTTYSQSGRSRALSR